MNFEEAAKYWTDPEDVSAPVFPLIHYEFFPPNEIFIKYGIGDVIGDPDYCGYEWDKDARIIDSIGAVYTCKFLNYKKSVYGLVYPFNIERHYQLAELKSLIKNVLKIQERDNYKNYGELKILINNSKTIKELIIGLSEQY